MNNIIYLDNAATTQLDADVVESMKECLINNYGNPSSSHQMGRKGKAALENYRRDILKILKLNNHKLVFTSCGTEADNFALHSSVRDLGCKHIITSPIEHKAVLECSQRLAKNGLCELHFVKINKYGQADLEDLKNLCQKYQGQAIVSLMHGNNEIGTINSLSEISKITREYQCLFHSDTVQTMAHWSVKDFQYPNFIVASAHKFHGPKGVGFLIFEKDLKVKSQICGGGQESELRGGTENLSGIAGLHLALSKSYQDMEQHINQLYELKSYAMKKLQENINGIAYNGCTEKEKSLSTILNIGLPTNIDPALLIFKLDLEGICVSGGSACSSGAQSQSHVIKELGLEDRTNVRCSFSKYNSKQDIDQFVTTLHKLIK